MYDIKDYLAPADEKPLDRPVVDGGYASIFRRVACIGDSLASGEFEAPLPDGSTGYFDCFEYSWGQFFARMCGSKVYNFSRGGMTAVEYCTSFGEANGFWDPDKAADAYIIALGCNDLDGLKQTVGSIDDVCDEDWHKNADTFAGWYGQLIQRYREIRPDAKYFLMTMPRGPWGTDPEHSADAHQKLLYDMAAHFPNTYVLDFRRYAPEYDEYFREQYFLRGHMNPMGYRLTAEMLASYIDYIIRHNMKDFAKVGFIGTPYSS